MKTASVLSLEWPFGFDFGSAGDMGRQGKKPSESHTQLKVGSSRKCHWMYLQRVA